MKHLYKALMAGLICLTSLLSIQSLQAQGCWKVVAKGCNSNYVIAIAKNGTLWAWGSNYAGQLGVYNPNNTPTQVGTDNNWSSAAVGQSHTIAIKTDGSLWAWGSNYVGEFGNGTSGNTRGTPLRIGTATNWLRVSAGYVYTMAIKTDGTLWAWGNNSEGQLGDGTNTDKYNPTQIGIDNNWQSVEAGFSHTIATKTDGTLWACGNNSYGQLGDGTTTNKNRPVQIGTATNWFTLAVGKGYTIARKADGTLWAWGWNSNGQLGDATTTDKNSPSQVGNGNNWLNVSAGNNHIIATKTDGSIWAWGGNYSGQLGNGTIIDKSSPGQIGTAMDWLSVKAGSSHTIAIKNDSTLWGWGSNSFGELGNGLTNNTQPTPPVTSPITITCPTVLPVTYTRFTTTNQGNSVLLNWQTANEVNNAYFNVQHSINGNAWVNIGTVNAGNGNYSFVHTTPATGINYYRLQQVDKDGKTSLSDVRSINLTNSNVKLSIYPNPIVGGNLVIDIAKEITQPINYNVHNALGVLVQQGTISQRQQTITINILAKGLYLLRLSDGQTASFIKQ